MRTLIIAAALLSAATAEDWTYAANELVPEDSAAAPHYYYPPPPPFPAASAATAGEATRRQGSSSMLNSMRDGLATLSSRVAGGFNSLMGGGGGAGGPTGDQILKPLGPAPGAHHSHGSSSGSGFRRRLRGMMHDVRSMFSGTGRGDPGLVGRLRKELMSIIPGSNKPKRHIPAGHPIPSEGEEFAAVYHGADDNSAGDEHIEGRTPRGPSISGPSAPAHDPYYPSGSSHHYSASPTDEDITYYFPTVPKQSSLESLAAEITDRYKTAAKTVFDYLTGETAKRKKRKPDSYYAQDGIKPSVDISIEAPAYSTAPSYSSTHIFAETAPADETVTSYRQEPAASTYRSRYYSDSNKAKYSESNHPYQTEFQPSNYHIPTDDEAYAEWYYSNHYASYPEEQETAAHHHAHTYTVVEPPSGNSIQKHTYQESAPAYQTKPGMHLISPPQHQVATAAAAVPVAPGGSIPATAAPTEAAYTAAVSYAPATYDVPTHLHYPNEYGKKYAHPPPRHATSANEITGYIVEPAAFESQKKAPKRDIKPYARRLHPAPTRPPPHTEQEVVEPEAITTSKPKVTVSVTKSVTTSVQRVIGKAIVEMLKNEYEKKEPQGDDSAHETSNQVIDTVVKAATGRSGKPAAAAETNPNKARKSIQQ